MLFCASEAARAGAVNGPDAEGPPGAGLSPPRENIDLNESQKNAPRGAGVPLGRFVAPLGTSTLT